MRYTVVYDPAAENRLAEIWLSAPDPNAVEDASNEIDRQLKRWPERIGQPFGLYRRLAVYPLVVDYTVVPDDRMVRVIRIALLP